MYLTKLEVVGFKSFVNKTTFDFSKGITAIVGPNGSGKSNVADAIRWALGEQSFKNLRGKKVDDIIFSGTEKRKPLSFCEVSLTFDNSDSFFAIDYNELVITRRAYRSGENEYFINGNSCRLKDITMLLNDTGVGKEGYSIIGQNKIDSLISNKSEHMREILDEAAGVMKYKMKKEEAERKLERTQANIERIEDLLEALGVQLEPLSIQSSQAKEYFETRDKLKALEATAFFNSYNSMEIRQEKLNNEAKEIEADIEQHKSNIQQTALELSSIDENEKETEQNISDCQQEIIEMTSKLERQKGDAQLFDQKVNYIKENNTRLNEEISEIRVQSEDIKEELKTLENKSIESQQGLSEANEALRISKDKYDSENSSVFQMESEIEKSKNELMNRINKASEAKMQSTRLNTMSIGIDERIKTIGSEKERIEPLIKELEAEKETLVNSTKTLSDKQKELSSGYNELTSHIQELKVLSENAKDKEREIEKKISEISSRVKILSDMQRAYEGFNMPIKRLMQHSEQNSELKNKILGVVANVINVPSKYAKAVENALGAALQNIISQDEQDAKFIINCLRENNFGTATILPVNVIRPRNLDEREKVVLKEKGCIGIASDLITYDLKYDGIIKNLLGRTIFSEDMDMAINIARKCHHSLKIVTLKGDIINAGGSMTGGSSLSKTAGILEREQVLLEEKQKLILANKELSELKAKTSDISRLEELNIKQRQIAQEINDLNVAIAIENEKTETVKMQLFEKEKSLQGLQSELEQLIESKQEVEKQLEAIDQAHTTVESDNKELQREIVEKSKKLLDSKKELQILLTDYNEKSIRIANLEKEYAIVLNKINDRTNEIKKLGIQEAEKQRKIEENLINLDNMLNDNSALNGEETLMQDDLKNKKEELEELRNKLHSLKQDKATLNENLIALNNLIDEKSDRSHKIELSLLKMQNDIDMAIKTLYTEFEITVEQAKNIAIKEPVKNLSSMISMLREQLRSIGVINPNAITDYNNVKAKYDELWVQKDDLFTAKVDLEKIVAELYSDMNSQFNTEFRKLNNLFNETFCEIFGGGRAEIKLINENDMLNSPVEIISQPPGKKLENMTLLSGGESALTAIALMLSVIKLRPTPFCVLDEIEASLDEANTFKLANYLKRYSDKSQFMLITHQKASMASSDTLYGVAMEEKGVSKIVSVKMEQYEENEKAV